MEEEPETAEQTIADSACPVFSYRQQTRLKISALESLACLSGHVTDGLPSRTPGDRCRAQGRWQDFKEKRTKRMGEEMSSCSFD